MAEATVCASGTLCQCVLPFTGQCLHVHVHQQSQDCMLKVDQAKQNTRTLLPSLHGMCGLPINSGVPELSILTILIIVLLFTEMFNFVHKIWSAFIELWPLCVSEFQSGTGSTVQY